MITVADIISLPAFNSIELLVPCEGAGSRLVHNVGIMDVSPDYFSYDVYKPGEFIVTNLGFANGDVDVADEAVEAMARRGVSAIAIKTVMNPPISERARQASRTYHVPIYIYTGAYHEMVAFQALDLIRRDEQESNKSEAIEALLTGRSAQGTRETVHSIANITGATMRCVAAAPTKSSADDCSLYAVLARIRALLDDYRINHKEVETVYACRYHESILAIVSYGVRINPQDSESLLEELAESAGNLCCGVGDEVAISDGDLTVRQALALLDMARAQGKRSINWFEAGIQGFECAARTDRLFSYTCELFLSKLKTYDQANDSELVQTARAFESSYGDVKAAADKLYQHPNTVRYRLRKIKALMGMPDVSDRELMVFLTLVFLGREERGTDLVS